MTDKIIATVSITERIATVTNAGQTGPESWNQRRISREFTVNRSIQDVLKWAENMGFENPRISDIVLSEYTGTSV